MRFQLDEVSSKFFDKTKEGNKHVFAAEASCLYRNITVRPIYDDACDVGFIVRSEWTGKPATFYLAKEVRDNCNDVMYTLFQSDDAKNTEIVVFND